MDFLRLYLLQEETDIPRLEGMLVSVNVTTVKMVLLIPITVLEVTTITHLT